MIKPADSIYVVAGTNENLVDALNECFQENGCTGVKMVFPSKENRTDSVNGTQTESVESPGFNFDGTYRELVDFTAGRLVSQVILCLNLGIQQAVAHDPVRSWKKHSFYNIEVPLGILEALAPNLSKSSRVLSLTGENPAVPVASNGFYAASKTALEFLMHSYRLENPCFAITTGSIENAAIGENDEAEENNYKSIAADVYAAVCSPLSTFIDNDWCFPSA